MEKNENLKKIEEMLRDRFHKTPIYKKLIERRTYYERRMDVMNAGMINKRIKEEWINFLEQTRTESMKVEEFMERMSREDNDRCMTELFGVMVMTNIMDFLVADLNETFRKYHKVERFSMFDKVVDLSKECVAQVAFMCKDASYAFQDKLAECSDDLQEKILAEVKEAFLEEVVLDEAGK